LKTQNKLKHII